MDKAANQKQGSLAFHSGPVTLKDVALHAKVSEVAVGRVLLGSGKNSVRVGAKTADRIREIADQLGYQPNRVAQQLAGKRSKVIGVIIDSYAAQVDFIKLSEMERQAAKRGYRFMVGQSHGELERIQAYSVDFAQRGVEGIICVSHTYPQTGAKVTQIFNRMKNVVYVYHPEFLGSEISYVDVDLADGIKQAFDYLARKGRKQIALVTASSSDNCPILDRYQGYDESLLKHSGRQKFICDFNRFGNFDRLDALGESQLTIMAREINKLVVDQQVDAMLVENDYLAFMMIKLLRDLKVRIPQDVSIVGYDNLQLGLFYDPQLTTLDQRPLEQAQIAVDMLLEMIEGRELSREKRQIILKPKLIVRESA